MERGVDDVDEDGECGGIGLDYQVSLGFERWEGVEGGDVLQILDGHFAGNGKADAFNWSLVGPNTRTSTAITNQRSRLGSRYSELSHSA